jgi:hypothetical protein
MMQSPQLVDVHLFVVKMVMNVGANGWKLLMKGTE